MSCYLTLSGEDFDVDGFIAKSGLSSYSVFYKGAPVHVTKPDGKKIPVTGCSMTISNAAFTEFKQQVEDAISYLQTQREILQHIPSEPNIQYAWLDFGVTFNPANGLYQGQYIPTELLIPAAEFGISIELSMYAPSLGEEPTW